MLEALRATVAGLLALAAAAALGAAAAEWRAEAVASPPYVVSDEGPVALEGWVVANETSDSGPRLRLLVRTIEGVAASPRYVRVAVADAGVLTPGRAASCTAVLGSPAGPLAPGAYDFSRRAYFERLGATGFAFGRCRPAAFAPPQHWLDSQRLRLAALRADLSAAIVEAAPGRGGAIGAALVTGDRSSVDSATNNALRDSGLGHLLSVSGIHMGVVGGLVFALVLRALSLFSPIALRWPVKKIAAAAALIALAAYLVISGMSVPALRSFVMACVAFGAVLLDRPALSMRGLALAAVLVVLIFPESVLEPGFQMSFAATMALVALFEMMKRPAAEPALPTPGPLIGMLQSAWRGIGAVLLISLVAGLATDPFAIYHFQRFAVYALPANLITAPIMSFLVAPLAALAALLAPFGWADPVIALMSGALDLIAAAADIFGNRPEAVQALPRPPDVAFVLWVCALVWTCLWRGGLRWGGAALMAAGVWLYVEAPQPIAAFDTDLRAVFMRVDGTWTLLPSRGRSTYARDRIGAMLGLSPREIEALAPPSTCTETACIARAPSGRAIVFTSDAAAAAALCDEAALVVSGASMTPTPAPHCPYTIDARDLEQRGGAFIYDTPTGLVVERAINPAVRRPWTHAPDTPQE